MPRTKQNRPKKAPTERADPCHKAPSGASARSARGAAKISQDQPWAAANSFRRASCSPIRFPISSPSAAKRLDRADHDLEFDHFAQIVEFDEIDALELPFADIGGKFERHVVGAPIKVR